MGKTARSRNTFWAEDEEFEASKRQKQKYQDRRKIKRIKSALKTMNIDKIISVEDY